MSELAVVSLLCSLLFWEAAAIMPGGIIVPFYFALYLDDGAKIAATILAAAGAMGAVKLLSRYTILYGRRRFALYIVTGLLEKMLFTYLYFGNSSMLFDLSLTIGYLVPGILGNTMERQGMGKTLCALGVVVLMIKLAQILLI
jgi:poly-gamma-glutamate biosynthesis protein PgsC/CapC